MSLSITPQNPPSRKSRRVQSATSTPHATLHTTPAPRSYNAFRIRRHLRRVELRASGTLQLETYSFTQQGHQQRHCIEVNLLEGWNTCTCRNFRFRRRHTHQCKHIVRAWAQVKRRHDELMEEVLAMRAAAVKERTCGDPPAREFQVPRCPSCGDTLGTLGVDDEPYCFSCGEFREHSGGGFHA